MRQLELIAMAILMMAKHKTKETIKRSHAYRHKGDVSHSMAMKDKD